MSTLRDKFRGCIAWHRRNPRLPTSPNDRAVLRLVYNEGLESELGLVCERADGTYWCFTTSHSISGLPYSVHLNTYKSKDEAASVLFEHVLDELVRVCVLTSERYNVSPTLKKRDKKACSAYRAEAKDFKAGASWILQSEGFPRRPDWAKYLVQNADGRFVWFEQQPELLSGTWCCDKGRSQVVRMAEHLTSRIVRLL